jgi:hypothetical protein
MAPGRTELPKSVSWANKRGHPDKTSGYLPATKKIKILARYHFLIGAVIQTQFQSPTSKTLFLQIFLSFYSQNQSLC